ncbi:helix-turn-helix domain-containing protein [Arthrobacter pigmenti]
MLAAAFHTGSRLQRDAEGLVVDVSIVNLSVLKNDRAKAIRYSTLAAICSVLECQVGDLLVIRQPEGL